MRTPRRAQRPIHVLISSGPTREPIDPVRFLSNYSTGYMGSRLALEALARGHRVTVVSGPSTEPLPGAARVIPVERARDMARALRQQGRYADVIIMAAAVTDFRVVRRSHAKLARRPSMRLQLQGIPDIISRLPRRRDQLMVGFALETAQILPRARRKLRTKRLDVLVAQDARRRPFGRRKVRAWLLDREGHAERLGELSKAEVARVLLDKIEALWYGQAVAVRLNSRQRVC